jgi:hypothetical protein
MILLEKKLGFKIGCVILHNGMNLISYSRRRTKYFETRKRLQIPSVRKNPTGIQEQREALNELSEKNPDGSWGVVQTRGRLAQTGVLVTR